MSCDELSDIRVMTAITLLLIITSMNTPSTMAVTAMSKGEISEQTVRRNVSDNKMASLWYSH